jgi:hypothetical protein
MYREAMKGSKVIINGEMKERWKIKRERKKDGN